MTAEARYGLEPAPAAERPDRAGFGALLSPPYTRATVLFAAVTLATLFAWYALGTWLPQLMRQSGFNLGSALGFLMALNLGAVAAPQVGGWLLDGGLGVNSNFLAFGIAAVLAGGLLWACPHPARETGRIRQPA